MPATKSSSDFSLGVKVKLMLGRLLGHAGGKDITMSVVHNISRTDDEYTRARRAVEALRTLPHNWDGDGAPQLSKRSLDRALTVLGVLERESSFIPGPRVSAMPDGGVHLLWTRVTGKGRLEAEARITEEGDQVTIGYAHLAGFEVDDHVHDEYELAQRIRDRFKAE